MSNEEEHTLEERWEAFCRKHQINALSFIQIEYGGRPALDIQAALGQFKVPFDKEGQFEGALRNYDLEVVDRPEASGAVTRIIVAEVQ